VYAGQRYVIVIGRRTATVSQDDIQRLRRKVEDIDYFSLPAEYGCNADDIPGVATTVTLDGRVHSNANCGARFSDVPTQVTELEQLVDTVTNSAQWVGAEY